MIFHMGRNPSEIGNAGTGCAGTICTADREPITMACLSLPDLPKMGPSEFISAIWRWLLKIGIGCAILAHEKRSCPQNLRWQIKDKI